jgi:hypothetical protein
MCLEEIYGENIEEYRELQYNVLHYEHRPFPYLAVKREMSKIEFVESYMEMYITEKSSDELKSYIIQLVDPIEIR